MSTRLEFLLDVYRKQEELLDHTRDLIARERVTLEYTADPFFNVPLHTRSRAKGWERGVVQ